MLLMKLQSGSLKAQAANGAKSGRLKGQAANEATVWKVERTGC